MRPWHIPALLGLVILIGLATLALLGRFSVLQEANPGAGWAGAGVPAATFDPAFQLCAHCHQIGEGARHLTGPDLTHVVGRAAGRAPGYPFSKAMRDSGLVWDAGTLARFLEDPQAVVPGTRMLFPGISDQNQARKVINFLQQAGSEGLPQRASAPLH